MKSSLAIGLLSLVLAGSAAPAAAKDLCFSTSQEGTFFRFTKAKLPKKPGANAPLTGAYVAGDATAPATGAATRTAEGLVVIGVHVHSLGIIGNDFATTMIADANLAASGSYRDIGPTSKPLTWTWLPVDCKLVPVP